MAKIIYDDCPKCEGQKDERAKQCKKCYLKSLELDTSSGFLKCPKCEETKTLNLFRLRDKRGKKTKCNVCIDCERKYGRESMRQRRLMFLEGYPVPPNTSWKNINLNIKVADKNGTRKSQIRNLLKGCGIKDKSKLEKVYDMYFETFACQICGTKVEDLEKTLNVDHCHETNSIRGFLCSNCNTGIGFLKDSKDILLKALDYLNQSPIVLPDDKDVSGEDST